MLSAPIQSLLILLVVIAFYAIDVFAFRRYDKQRKAEGRGRAWDFTLLALVACALLVVRPLLLPRLGWRTEASWGLIIQGAGILLAAASLALNAWGRAHLRQFYAERVEVQPGHRVVTTGPYAWVRHPIITSFFGLIIGLFLIDPAVTTLLGMVYTFWDFGRAARQEEKLLAETLPEYRDYMNRTPRFLPRLWRRK
ncbi:MAG: isoprenylcysteine carboxylmethyltransferase family protein [Anaerolineales bacterium]